MISVILLEKISKLGGIGQEVKVKVLDVDRGRIKLSMKDLSEDEEITPVSLEDDKD